MLNKEIEKIIRKFDYENFGIHIDARDKTHEWPPVLAELIVTHVGKRIFQAVNDSQQAAL